MLDDRATELRQTVLDTFAPRRGTIVLNLAPFLALSRELSVLLVPVRPDAEFRGRLEESLLTAARLQHARSALDIHVSEAELPATAYERIAEHLAPAAGSANRRWVIGATALGSALSIAGLVAYWWRHRSQEAA